MIRFYVIIDDDGAGVLIRRQYKVKLTMLVISFLEVGVQDVIWVLGCLQIQFLFNIADVFDFAVKVSTYDDLRVMVVGMYIVNDQLESIVRSLFDVWLRIVGDEKALSRW